MNPLEEEKEHSGLVSEYEDISEDNAVEFTNIDLRLKKDVIFKRIIRSWKKFYSKKFQKFIGKTRQKFAKIKQDKERITRYAGEFLRLKFGTEASNEMEQLLYWFIDRKNKKRKERV